MHYYDPVMDMAYYVRRKQMQARLANVRQALESANTDALLHELENLYGQDLTGMQQYHYLLALNQSLWELYVSFLSSAHRPAPDPTRLTRLNSMENPSAMRELMSDLLSALPRAAEEGTYSRRVREIIDYISAHFREEISLESIANVFCVHKTHLARLFKTETGMSLSEFIRRYRVNAAKTLLRDSRFRVNEIAYQVGFNSTQSFYNAFMHCEGVAPKLYREYYC
ncbi:MAG: AraC family transcriptional regulator [Clostridia bacterium]|nr:AraC family transcriptional regulator [Clostridia bacterium]